MPNWLGYKNYTANVSGWTYLGGRFARRDAGQPSSMTYSIQFEIESSGKPGLYEPIRAIVSGANPAIASKNVDC
jgi:hypothetical protein